VAQDPLTPKPVKKAPSLPKALPAATNLFSGAATHFAKELDYSKISKSLYSTARTVQTKL